MDFVYMKLRVIADSRTSSHNMVQDTFSITLERMNELVAEYVIDSLQATGFESYVPFYMKDTIIKDPIFSNRSFATHFNLVTQNSLSGQLTTAINEFEIFWRDDSKNQQYSSYDSLILVKVPLLDNEVDKMAFISAVSTGKSSMQYWEVNKTKWDILIRDLGGNGNFSSYVPGPKKGIIYSDIIGGMSGLIRGAYVGYVGGTIVVPGIGTVTGAAACGLVGAAIGGVGGSAADAAHSLIQWMINW